jgi:hypothetical protein
MSTHKPLLPVKKPVPEDIEIAQSIEPLHISKIAEKLGLNADEYDLYGIHKAKVCSAILQGLLAVSPEVAEVGHILQHPVRRQLVTGQAVSARPPCRRSFREVW